MKVSYFFFACLLSSFLAKAQGVTCNGILGNPILSFDFGQGNSTQTWYSPLSAYAPGLTTNTTFQANGPLPASNTSGLVKHTSAFGPAPYWLDIGDHTGNANGLLFGMNMPDNIGATVAEYEMNGLCPNTTLEFSIWLVNLMSPNHPLVQSNSPSIQYPNLIMRIVTPTGGLIAEHVTGNVPTDGIWHQYAFLFANGNNTSLKLQLINNTQGSGSGNDVALDDITLRPCVPVASIVPLLDTVLCQSTDITFHADISANIFSSPVFQWQYSTDQGGVWVNSGAPTNVNSTTFQFSTQAAPQEYWIRYLVSPGSMGISPNCQAVSNISIVKIDTIDHDFLKPNDTVICKNESLNIDVSTPNAVSYLWNTGAVTPYLLIDTSGQYSVELTSLYGCKASDTIQVTFKDVAAPNLGPDTLFCEGATYTLRAAGLNADDILWSTGATSETITVDRSGTYWVVISSEGCHLSDTVKVDFNPIPIVDLGDDFWLCDKQQIQLSSKSPNPGGRHLWSTGDTTARITISDSGKYWLQVTNLPDCVGSDTIQVGMKGCYCELFVPNAFSPNQDGHNDVFNPKMIPEACSILEYTFMVFNRWGQLVFETDDFQKGWDGTVNKKTADMGVYMYYIRFKEEMTGEVKVYKGDITLIK